LLLTVSLNAQSKREYIHYLKNHSLDMQDSLADWDSFPDSSFYRNDLFWVGEAHAIKYSYDAQRILFEQIHGKTGFKYYLLEAGYISEIYLNNYLETGDEKYLNMKFNSMKGTMGCNVDAFEFYRKLYRYNQGLLKEKRIEFVSIDIEHQYPETDLFIRSLFKNADLPKDSGDFVNLFLWSHGNYKYLYGKLFADMVSDPGKYKMILKNDYSRVWYMARNINYLFLATASANWDKTRDSLMLENYKIRVQDHDFKKSKVFAYFGTSHCYLEKTRHVDWIASLIKNYDPSLKATSIMMLYADSKAMIPVWLLVKTGYPHVDKNKDYENVSWNNDPKKILGKSSGKGYTLFSIAGAGSVFRSLKLFVNDIDRGKFTPDYFQYILFIKGSPASLPYGK
jgi:hypothetical protein